MLIWLLQIHIYLIEKPSADEVEVYVALQQCLEMRKRYVFKDEDRPWDKEVISNPSTQNPNMDPSEGRSEVSL